MAPKIVQPTLGADSFNCPTCGALAHQDWYLLQCRAYESDTAPWIPDAGAPVRAIAAGHPDVAEFFKKRLLQVPFLDHGEDKWSRLRLENVNVSECFSCRALAIWVYDQPIFPPSSFSVEPNTDLEEEIKLDYREAAKILDLSPRGAAAILRLCVQKLCIQLGEAGKNIDADIASLVRKGLEPSLQRALDIVRVIGNESVHPGQIDLRDDRETATKLFHLVNIIADAMISRPKQIAELYGKLPESKLRAIEKRDGSNEPKQQ